MFVNSEFTINDRFCLNPGNAFKQATAIVIFVDFIFVLNFVFVQKVLCRLMNKYLESLSKNVI